MNIVSWKDFVENGFPQLKTGEGAAISIGVFDGVHIGHQKLIQHIVENPFNSIPVIITFENNPSEILHPHKYLGNLSTLPQKIWLFERRSVHHVVLIDFSTEFSKLSGKQFFKRVNEKLQVRFVSIGKNFHCGRDSDTNAFGVKEIMTEENAQVEIVEQVRYKEDIVSSTRIRNAVLDGRMEDVEYMLGRPYALDVRETGFLNLNRKIILKATGKQLLPKPGKYNVSILANNEERRDTLIIENDNLQLEKTTTQIDEIYFIKK